MADSESLALTEKNRPETAAGNIGVVMLVASGRGEDTQWFDYRPGFYQDIVRVEWDKDTMHVVLPPDVSEYLLRNNYARLMTAKEARTYNHALAKAVDKSAAETETPSRKPAAETPSPETEGE